MTLHLGYAMRHQETQGVHVYQLGLRLFGMECMSNDDLHTDSLSGCSHWL